MKVNIDSIRQFNDFFDLHEESIIIEKIDYGKLYVLAQDKEWNQSVEQAITKIHGSASYKFLHMDYNVVMMEANSWPRESFLQEKNLFMPLFTPDRYSHYYLSGIVTHKEDFESILSFMLMEAHQIGEKCSEAAFVNLGNWDADDLFDIGFEQDSHYNFDQISFRGRSRNTPDPTSFLKNKDKVISKLPLSYAERVQKLRQLPIIAKRIRSTNNAEAESDFAVVWNAMTERERGHLCFELLKRSRKKDVADIIGATIDRELMGEKSRFTVIIKSNPTDEDLKNFDNDYNLCTYLKDSQGRLIPLRFSHTTQVLYTLSLINKKINPQNTPILSILNNEKAFSSIYNAMFGVTHESFLKKEFDKLFQHMTSTSSVHSGDLGGRYNEIESRLVEIFNDLDENPLPYITRDNYPLAINAKNIEIPQILREIDII